MEQIMYPAAQVPDFMHPDNVSRYEGSPSEMDIGFGSGGSEADGSNSINDDDMDKRAPLSMRPKRAGRKLDTKEPQSKRRAQNRAAQRAFRERKERHLKELETRIAELEQESATWRNSSLLLRSKVSELEQELTKSSGPSAAQHRQQPEQLQQPQQPHQQPPALHAQQQPPPHHRPLPHQSIQQHSRPSPPQRNQSVDSLFYSESSASTTNESTPQSAISGLTPAQVAMSGNPSPNEFCDELGLACVVPKDMFKGLPTPPTASSTEGSSSTQHTPRSTGGPSVPLPQSVQNPTPQSAQNEAPAALESAPFDGSVTDFSFPAESSNEPFDVFQFVNNESTMFDAFNLDAIWDTPSQQELLPDIFSQKTEKDASRQQVFASAAPSPLQSQPQLPAQQQPQQQLQRSTPSMPSSVSARTPTAPTPPSAAAAAAAAGVAPPAAQGGSDVVASSSEKYISCTEVWDRICSRPRFGEIDIQGMCSELRAKAKCSDQGVVLPERELERFLNSYS